MAKELHFWHRSVFLWEEEEKKKTRCHTLLHIWFALRKVCSQLLCASGCCGESLAREHKPRQSFSSFSSCQRFPERVSVAGLKLEGKKKTRPANLTIKQDSRIKNKKGWYLMSCRFWIVKIEGRSGVDGVLQSHNSTVGLKAAVCWAELHKDTYTKV